MTTTAESVRAYRGPALFSYGFRPFFLFAAAWAAIAVPVWVASLLLGDGSVAGMDGLTWHKHEMLFGFVPGVIAGFLLTAVPNWTGRLPVTGTRLAILFGFWLFGRLAMLVGGGSPGAAVIDSAFLLLFAGVVWREVLAGGSKKNLPVCALLSGLALANVAFHLEGAFPVLGTAPERAALAAITALIALIGGRIVPSFTRNWLAARGPAALPAPFGRVDQLTLGVTVVGLTGFVVAPAHALTGATLSLAGLLTLVRVARWRGWATVADPLVWILHLGCLWLALGLGLTGAAILAPDWVPRTAGVHALTAGAIGVMILAVTTRASLGHTGRPRVANRATTAIYVLANAAALLRILAPFGGEAQPGLLGASAALWTAAFGGFALAYAPILARRRVGAA